MDIPILSSFVEGLKIFLENKKLKWLTIVFIVGLVVIASVGALALSISQVFPDIAVALIALFGGVWPIFFLLSMILSFLGLQRFIASEESYKQSLTLFIPWLIASVAILILLVMYAIDIFTWLIFGIAFVGWISFQAYFSTRNSLKYADTVGSAAVTRWKQGLAGFSHILCYVAIVGSLVYTLWTNMGAPYLSILRILLMVLGAGFAGLFNFTNGVILSRYRNKDALVNISLIGVFISFYSAYFIYNAGRPVNLEIDFISLGISIFFVIYTMSSVGLTLAKRADLDTRWKLSKEVAASTTFFLASGYFFADALLPVIFADPVLGASMADLVKLFLFPFIALVMELVYLRKRGKVHEPPEEPSKVEETPPIQEEPHEDDSVEMQEETPEESEDIEIEESIEEPLVEEESEDEETTLDEDDDEDFDSDN